MISVFIVRYMAAYCRFGSYRQLQLVSHPAKATIYSRQRDAEKRKEEDHWMGDKKIPASELRVFKVTFEVVRAVPV